jgi:hypothetical protein
MAGTLVFSDRCLWDVTGLAREKWVTVGDNAHGGRERVSAPGSIRGYRWNSRLAPIDCLPNPNFKDYATNWEQRYSVLTPNRTSPPQKFAPVVSDKSRSSFNPPVGGTWSAFPVVAHYGSTWCDDIIVLRKFATSSFGSERREALERLLDRGIEAYVERDYPDAGNWGPFAERNNIGPNHFTVLTDPEGLILACLDAYGAEPGLESEDPLSYLMVATALLDLVKVGGRVALRMISQRAARKAAERALAGEIETLTLEELGTIRGGTPSASGPLMSAEELNKLVPQIREGMGVKRLLTDAERKGAREILGILERVRANPKDAESLLAQIANRSKKMQFGRYAQEGWTEIDLLAGNPGGLNQMRLLVRVAKGESLNFEVKLLQMH